MFRLEFEMKGLPKIPTNGSHGHWAQKAKERRNWRDRTVVEIGRQKPNAPLPRALATFIRYSSAEPDSDNLAASFKSIRDGLKDAGVIIDDSRKFFSGRYFWQPGPRGKGFVRIIVEELSASQWEELAPVLPIGIPA